MASSPGVSRRDFNAIAAMFATAFETCDKLSGEEVLLDLSGRLADYFAGQNERFNRQMFLDACGIVEEYV